MANPAMNRSVAYQIITAELAIHQQLGYDQLASLIGKRINHAVMGEDGVYYAIETSVNWRADADGDLIVCVEIAPADWGAPHDCLEESIIISR
jgi:hypothetical protein